MATQDDGFRLDAHALKVLAHPLRSRLLSALRLGGPATATELAVELSTNTGATSYHLRKLESVGLVTDTEEGEGKRRLWRASTRSHQWEASDFNGDEDAETAMSWLVRDYVRHQSDRFERWLDIEAAWPLAWRDALGLHDDVLTVTPEQLAAFTGELGELMARYRDAGVGDPNARRIASAHLHHPVDLDQQPERDLS